jgi:excisionase family DNA binding protein
MEAKFLRVKEACEIYSVSRKTLYKMLADGHIDGERTPGGHRRISRESLDDYFTKGTKFVIALMDELGL